MSPILPISLPFSQPPILTFHRTLNAFAPKNIPYSSKGLFKVPNFQNSELSSLTTKNSSVAALACPSASCTYLKMCETVYMKWLCGHPGMDFVNVCQYWRETQRLKQLSWASEDQIREQMEQCETVSKTVTKWESTICPDCREREEMARRGEL